MDHQITTQDLEFSQWLDNKGWEPHGEKDEKGEKVILRSGWDGAQAEFNRIKEHKKKKTIKIWRAIYGMDKALRPKCRKPLGNMCEDCGCFYDNPELTVADFTTTERNHKRVGTR